MISLNFTLLVNLLILSIVSFELTSSASFPNPPQKPPSNASPDQQALFWKLLHNYYAIIGRPRFGKRSNSAPTALKYSVSVPTFDQDLRDLCSSIYSRDRTLSGNNPYANDQRIDLDNIYAYEYPEERRRRRRRRRR